MRNKRSTLLAEWRDRNPEAYRAHNAVNNAIKVGKLVRQPCSVCGEVRSAAHHEDYSKPFDVIWFCHRHHTEHHSGHPINERPRYQRAITPPPDLPKRGRVFRQYLKPMALRRREEGVAYRRIADELGVNVSTIHRWVNTHLRDQ